MMYWLAAAQCDPAEVPPHHTCEYEQPHWYVLKEEQEVWWAKSGQELSVMYWGVLKKQALQRWGLAIAESDVCNVTQEGLVPWYSYCM